MALWANKVEHGTSEKEVSLSSSSMFSRVFSFLQESRTTLFAYIFLLVVSFLSRGQAILGRFSVDDYEIRFLNLQVTEELSLSQGRFLSVFLNRLVYESGISNTALGWAVWPIVIGVYTLAVVFVLQIFRININLLNLFIASMAISHPYLAEIFTFQATALTVLIGAILLTLFLSLHTQNFNLPKTILFSIFILYIMLSLYQINLNFILMLIGFLPVFIALSIADTKHLKKVFLSFTISVFVSGVLVYLSARLTAFFSGIEFSSRGQLISITDIPDRFLQLFQTTSLSLFGFNEPVFGGIFKLLFGVVTIVALLAIFIRLLINLFTGKNKVGKIWVTFALFSVVILTVLLPGIVSFFESWWPVPRVLSHISLFASLAVFASFYGLVKPRNIYLFAMSSASFLISFAGIIFSNQIFSDQASINRYDESLAQRIIQRLDENPDTAEARQVAIVGNFYSHELTLPTMQGDLNISAFWTAAPISLLKNLSGKEYYPPTPEIYELAKSECEMRKIFPSADSVFVIEKTAVVCITKP